MYYEMQASDDSKGGKGRGLRRNNDKMIAGVASGFARFFRIDPVLARLLFVILAFVGPGIPIYLIAWVLMPRSREVLMVDDEPIYVSKRSPGFISLLFKGVILFIAVALLTEGFETNFAMALFFVGLAIGGYVFWKNMQGESIDEESATSGTPKARLYRSVTDKKIAGVFGGLAERFGIDATLLRIVGVLLLFAGIPVTVICYFIYTLVVPKEELTVRVV